MFKKYIQTKIYKKDGIIKNSSENLSVRILDKDGLDFLYLVRYGSYYPHSCWCYCFIPFSVRFKRLTCHNNRKRLGSCLYRPKRIVWKIVFLFYTHNLKYLVMIYKSALHIFPNKHIMRIATTSSL